MNETTPLNIQPIILFTPVLILIMAGLGLGSGLIITSLTTKYRDLALLVQFGIQLLMYATLMIPKSATTGFFYKILAYNPMIPIIETMRQAFFNTSATSWLHIGYSFVVMLILVVVGYYIFTKTEKTFTDTV
ncbi:MAG: ABC transporter permease [Saprospirales bacterium]|nr:ABC transporter permease [Saprospirales bacterium]